MNDTISRRRLLGGALTVTFLPQAAWSQETEARFSPEDTRLFPGQAPAKTAVHEEQFYNPDLLPPPESEIDFPIEPINLRLIPKKYWAQMVDFDGSEEPGTLVVDPDNRFLYHVLAYGQAKRYGVGVGRAGFEWSGAAKIGMKRRWPRWVPPSDMVDRDERAKKWANGQPGGPDNPLGARALYLYSNGVDTLYRIHGTNEPQSIGKAMSSGCIRMLNQDVAELYDNVIVGTPVNVRPSHNV